MHYPQCNGTGDWSLTLTSRDITGIRTVYGVPTPFVYKGQVLEQFGYNQGWRIENHVRLMAEINGDGRLDIVGFAHGGGRTAINEL